jgi:putative lipoic acid-binding regulatory protein
LQFPCDFPIKIMGAGDFDLRMLAVELVRRHAPDLDEARVRVRDSRAGRYQSVTVVVRARAARSWTPSTGNSAATRTSRWCCEFGR